MSFKIMAEIWEYAQVSSSSELFVLLTIAEHARQECRHAWPGYVRIAARTRLDERTVKRIVPRLREQGFLLIHIGAGPRHQNVYTVMPLVEGWHITTEQMGRCGNCNLQGVALCHPNRDPKPLDIDISPEKLEELALKWLTPGTQAFQDMLNGLIMKEYNHGSV